MLLYLHAMSKPKGKRIVNLKEVQGKKKDGWARCEAVTREGKPTLDTLLFRSPAGPLPAEIRATTSVAICAHPGQSREPIRAFRVIVIED
jgi:hypothetical protein